MSDTPHFLQIKGLRDGLLITLADAPWETVSQALLAHIGERQSFFQGARLALDVGQQALKVIDLADLRDRLSDQGVSLWAVLSESPTTQNAAQLLGLATRLFRPRLQEFEPAPSSMADETALWLHRTLRSGVRVESPGHVVIWGDVNPGAEVVAAGHILVWGRLRGSVHAGAQGDRNAMIAALEFSPMQARIANQEVVISDPKPHPGPKVIAFRDDRLTVDDWQAT